MNLQVGYAGLLQLGIAAFFAIGAFTAGILTVDETFASFGSPVIVAEPALDASPEGGLSQGIYRG